MKSKVILTVSVLFLILTLAGDSFGGLFFSYRVSRSGCSNGRCTVSPRYQKPKPEQVSRPYVVRVRCGHSAGSGTIVQWKGEFYVLTAAHVVGSKAVDAVFKTAKGVYRAARVIARTKVYDMAILKPVDQSGLTATEISDGMPAKSQELIRAGYGSTGYYQEVRGKFSNRIWRPSSGAEKEWGQSTNLARSGDSGGPLLDVTGRLVGVLHHKTAKNGPGLAIFTVAARVRQFLFDSLGPDQEDRIPQQDADDSAPVPVNPIIALPEFSSRPEVIERLALGKSKPQQKPDDLIKVDPQVEGEGYVNTQRLPQVDEPEGQALRVTLRQRDRVAVLLVACVVFGIILIWI